MKIITITSCTSSKLSNKPEENGADEIRIKDKEWDSGSQGQICEIISIDGKNVYGLLVKLFDKSFPANLRDIIEIIRENKDRYKIDQCVALRALPLFLFEGKSEGNSSYGYVMRKVEGEKFDVDDEKQFESYINLSLKDRLEFCYQFAEGMSILYALTIIHADINGSNLIIDQKNKMLTIIDLDGGSVAKTESLPKVWGKKTEPHWLAPEILSQINNANNVTINVKISADLWSIACGIHYLLFGLPPFFFIPDYLDIPHIPHLEWII